MVLKRLRREELPVNVPLPWPLFDKNGTLYIKEGAIVRPEQIDALLDSGIYRILKDDSDTRSLKIDLTKPVPRRFPEIPKLFGNLENIRITYGAGVQKVTVETELYGVIPDMSFILKHPVQSGRLIPVQIGQRLVVQILLDTKVYSFASTIVGLNKYPNPYLHLEYPENISVSTLRSAQRKNLSFDVTAIVDQGDIRVPTSILDISDRGLSFVAEYEIGNVGSEVDIAFSLPLDDDEVDFNLQGVIRNLKARRNNTVFRYGVEFKELEEAQRHSLERCLFRI